MKNIYSKSLLNVIFSQSDDNIVINENDKMISLINEILLTKNKAEKNTKFNKLRSYVNSTNYTEGNILFPFLHFINTSFEDFFNDYYIKNSILVDDDCKDYFVNILINIYKYIIVFPNHIKIYNDSNNLKMLQTKVNSLKLSKKEINYLKGDQDDKRLSDYTSNNEMLIYISSIDSYYYIYDRIKIYEKPFQLLIEIYNYLDELDNKSYSNLIKVIKELSKILKYCISKYYNINIDTLIN